MKTISDHILDILQNSVTAGATLIEIIVTENKKNDFYSIEISDNGCGMDAETLQKATDPFFTSRNTRKVGLGLSLLKQNAEIVGGSFELESELNKGTKVTAIFKHSNIDRPPTGKVWEVFYLTMLSYQNILLRYKHTTETARFEINSNEILEAIGNVPLKNMEIKEAIYELIKNNLKSIQATL